MLRSGNLIDKTSSTFHHTLILVYKFLRAIYQGQVYVYILYESVKPTGQALKKQQPKMGKHL